MDKRGQACGEVDEAVVPALQGQRGAVAVVRPSLQPGQLPAAAGATQADPGLDTNDASREVGQDRGQGGASFQVRGLSTGEVAVPRKVFAWILDRIGRLRLACASG